ncbi:class I SAM-dependent methyltransferase [Bacillus spongiae]|uniref:Class I SAM-dependent methyltransferase n=1 Tax=Bacillus spongiae TaxID=2683610 RepID=A0ABU8HGA3_9BACI
MTGSKEIWNKKYSEVNQLWGLKPKATLTQYVNLISKEGKVLDLGMGEGRNALYLASLGFEVQGVDISDKAIQRCNRFAKEKGLLIDSHVRDLREFKIEKQSYSLIILSNVLNFFNDMEISEILHKAKNGLIAGGLIYINTFDISDPGYEKHKEKYKEISTNTFLNPITKNSMHYFTKSELEDHFNGYKPITSSQTFSLDLGHGEPHYHGIIELLLQKQ